MPWAELLATAVSAGCSLRVKEESEVPVPLLERLAERCG